MSLRWQAVGLSDVGRVRQGNEDSFLVDAARGVFLVADGMGGHAAGEVASAMAAATVGGALAHAVDGGSTGKALDAVLVDSFRSAHLAIEARSADDPETRGMGTTLTACAVSAAGEARMGHVGDSRAYLLRGGVLTQVTRDHTWVQREVDAGRLSPRGARTHRLAHIITRALGADSPDAPDLLAFPVAPGDVLLLATDGLSGPLDDDAIARILASPAPLGERAAALIAAANAAGGPDNITAVLVLIE
ncbi:MAG: protein phosphatase domain protein [Gemmatimonadetes bacterium]|nr:protein phosphatase domain protein [Gemmatimonadota bacterium]